MAEGNFLQEAWMSFQVNVFFLKLKDYSYKMYHHSAYAYCGGTLIWEYEYITLGFILRDTVYPRLTHICLTRTNNNKVYFVRQFYSIIALAMRVSMCMWF